MQHDVERLAQTMMLGALLDEVALARIERAFPRGPWRGLPTL